MVVPTGVDEDLVVFFDPHFKSVNYFPQLSIFELIEKGKYQVQSCSFPRTSQRYPSVGKEFIVLFNLASYE